MLILKVLGRGAINSGQTGLRTLTSIGFSD